MDIDRAKDLSRFMDKKGLVELELEEEGFKVKIKKGPAALRKVARPKEKDLPRPPEEEKAEESAPSPDITAFTSLMVGTFYRRPQEGAAPYVQIGDQVEAGDVLCHIQAMGIINEIKSNIRGRIVEALVEDGHPVEYGQALFSIKPIEEEVDV